MDFVGKIVKKELKGVGIVSGTVKSHDSSSGFLEIVYENGDCEELEVSEVASLLEIQLEVPKVKARAGRKPKKRRRVQTKCETTAFSGNVSDNFVAGSEFSGTLNGDDSSGGNEGNLVGNGNGSGSVEQLGNEIGFGFNENLNLNGVPDNSINNNNIININNNDGNCVKDGIDLNAGLDLNEDIDVNGVCDSAFNDEGSLKRRDCIDLNLDVNDEVDVNFDVNLGGETLRQECVFDLNVGVCEEVKEAQGCADGNGYSEVDGVTRQLLEEESDVKHRSTGGDGVLGNLNCASDAIKLEEFHVSVGHIAEDASLCLIEEKEGHDGKENVAAVDPLRVSDDISVRDFDYVSFEAGAAVVNEYQNDPGSLCKQGSNQRKRRKVSDNLKATPDTALRRSSRRASARKRVSSAVSVEMIDDPLSSLETSVTEEKLLMLGNEKHEQCNVPIPKLQLPPSSQNLNLDDIPVLEFFSVYSCLRSFSTLLFLSPFELEDLVAALKSETPNALFDSIHVSILQTLRKHLDFLSNEGCQSASICLRYILF